MQSLLIAETYLLIHSSFILTNENELQAILFYKVLVFKLQIGTVASAVAESTVKPSVEGKCVMFGICGTNDNYEDVPCKVDQGPKALLQKESLSELEEYCPELLLTHGNKLCCDASQIANLVDNLKVPEAILINCPACFNNFRRSVCEFTCSPKQSLFVNITQTEPFTSEEEYQSANPPEATAERVVSVDFFISTKYIRDTYESCRSVIFGEQNIPAMHIMCGPWGASNCTAERWFDYMGSIGSGYYYPIELKYRYIHDTGSSEIHAQGTPSKWNQVESAREIPNEIEPLVLKTFKCSDKIYSTNNNVSKTLLLIRLMRVVAIICQLCQH